MSVLDVMGQLVDKSLVVTTETSDVMSFRLLETIRQYAEERLEEAGEVPATRTRHARHYLEVLERAAAAGRGGDTLDRAIRARLSNMVAAYEWFIAAPDADGALRLAVMLQRPQWVPGLSHVTAANLIAATLDVPGAIGHPLAPLVLAAKANLSLMVGGDPLGAFANAQRSLAIADDIGVEPSALHLFMVAAVALRSGHLDEGREFALGSASAASREGDDRDTYNAYFILAALERFSGNVHAAADAGARAEACARRSNSTDLLAGALMIQGYALRDVEPERALTLLEEGAGLSREISINSENLESCISNSGLIRLRRGDFAGARRDMTESLDIGVRVEGQEIASNACAKLALGLLDVGDASDARAAAELLAAAEQLQPPITVYASLGAGEAELAARLEAILGAETLAELRARGAAMDFDETVAFARSALAHVTEADHA